MTTVTVPKTQYGILRKRASLYETFMRMLPKRRGGADGIRQLSEHNLETFELLLDKQAMSTIKRSAAEARRGKVKEL